MEGTYRRRRIVALILFSALALVGGRAVSADAGSVPYSERPSERQAAQQNAAPQLPEETPATCTATASQITCQAQLR